VQAYGRRAMHALEFLEELARTHPETNIKVRLVKGAYWDGEIKEAQVQAGPGAATAVGASTTFFFI